MEKQALNTYQVKMLQSIQKQIKAYQNDFKPERLHRMRLSVKKVKAIASLKFYISNKKQNYKELKPLYKAAGGIREIQILIKLVKSLTGFPKKISAALKSKEKEQQATFLKKLPKFQKQIHKFQDSLSSNDSRVKTKWIVKYFEKQLQKASAVFLLQKREEMHTFRKQIKNILYVYLALPEKIQTRIPLNLTQLLKLQKKLGDWHDTYAAIYYLSKLKFHVSINTHVQKLKILEKSQFKILSGLPLIRN